MLPMKQDRTIFRRIKLVQEILHNRIATALFLQLQEFQVFVFWALSVNKLIRKHISQPNEM